MLTINNNNDMKKKRKNEDNLEWTKTTLDNDVVYSLLL